MRSTRKRHKKLDTSIDGYSYIGIKITQEQLSDLAFINTMIKTGAFDDAPVHVIILVLKTLGLIPTEIVNDIGNGNTADDTNNNPKESFERKFGRFNE